MSNGFQIPDPSCSPGAINPTLTLKVLKTKGFTTKCVRDQASSKKHKEQTYVWYDIEKPKNNSGKPSVAEYLMTLAVNYLELAERALRLRQLATAGRRHHIKVVQKQ
jgi:hypothetical protein